MKRLTFQKFLLTLDGSKLALAAVPYANVLAAQLSAEIILLQVVPTVEQKLVALNSAVMPPAASSPVLVDGKVAKELVENETKKAKAELKGLKISLENNSGRKISAIVKQGNAESTIIKVALQEKCDLIIISTHGRSGLGRALLGSVADYVTRHAKCPVMVIHPKGTKK